MYFKPEFKQKILDGTKVATIRKTKRLNVGTKFKVRIGTRFKSEYLADAECIGLIETNPIKYNCIDTLSVKFGPGFEFCILAEELGFTHSLEAENFYKQSLGPDLKGYLHIFKLIDNKD